jgi:hypothetical protein
MAEGKEEEKGPSLHLAADRIRPDYLERWVALPRRLVPYTSMTQYQPFWAHLKEPMTPDQRAPLLEAEYAMTPEDRVRAVRDALLSWGFFEDPENRPATEKRAGPRTDSQRGSTQP